MQLTEQQVSYFRTFGFLKFPGLLADAIGEIDATFGGASHRRMFTINLCQRYRDEDIPLLKESIAAKARF